jgi:hypothetical protein
MDAAFLKNRICIDQCKTSIDLSIRYLSHGHTENETNFFLKGGTAGGPAVFFIH